jgi:hypothetical protein
VAAEEKQIAITPASTSFGTQPANLEGDVRWEGKTGGGAWTSLEVINDETLGFRGAGSCASA